MLGWRSNVENDLCVADCSLQERVRAALVFVRFKIGFNSGLQRLSPSIFSSRLGNQDISSLITREGVQP